MNFQKIKSQQGIHTELIDELTMFITNATAISIPIMMIPASSPMMATPPAKPNSSDSMVKMKSVCFSGRKLRCPCVPCRYPLPQMPPEPSAMRDWMML